eukprot:scaffold105948_cov36-Prasinocladus_malaysianus.AAC.2
MGGDVAIDSGGGLLGGLAVVHALHHLGSYERGLGDDALYGYELAHQRRHQLPRGDGVSAELAHHPQVHLLALRQPLGVTVADGLLQGLLEGRDDLAWCRHQPLV